jgi:hypothetical protein
MKGRYYRPLDASPNQPQGDGLFTSQAVTIPARRRPAPGNSVSPASEGQVGPTVAATTEPAAFLSAVQWTALAEDVEAFQEPGGVWRIKPIFRDYRTTVSNRPPVVMSPDDGPDANGFAYETAAQMFVVVDGPSGRRWYGPYHNEVWSPIRESHKGGQIGTGASERVRIFPGEVVRYAVKLRPGKNLPINAVLLTTPVLDDVTLFFEYANVRFVSYAELRGLE